MPRVLVTGASRGIGRAVCARLATDGWDVLAGVRADADGEDLRRSLGERVRAIRLDVTRDADVMALGEHLAGGTGGLDAVVNNAGAPLDGPVEAIDVQRVRRLFELNVIGQLAVTQAVLPQLRASRGRVLFISSLNGRIATPMSGAYNATKFAVEAFADTLRIELRPWGVRVVLIEPGPIATELWTHGIERFDDAIAGLAEQHRELYAAQVRATRRGMKVLRSRAVPAEDVATVVARALRAGAPHARYQVNAAGRAQLALKALTPTPMWDAVLAGIAGARRRR